MRNGTETGRTRPGVVALALLALAPLPLAAQEAGPMTERAAVALLAEGAPPDRFRALDVALELGPRATPELKLAVIEATWAELRGETDTPRGSEALPEEILVDPDVHPVRSLLRPPVAALDRIAQHVAADVVSLFHRSRSSGLEGAYLYDTLRIRDTTSSPHR